MQARLILVCLLVASASCAPEPSTGAGGTQETSDSLMLPSPPPRHTPLPVPDGPRYVIADGVFDEGDWGAYQGKPWRYVAWGNRDVSCTRFEVGEPKGSEGRGCTHWEGEPPDGHLLARAYDPGSEDGIDSLVYGQVSTAVAEVELRLTNGDVVRLDVIPPPPELDVPVRYYFASVPFSYNGEMLALDARGEVLEKVSLCHGSCGRSAS